MLRFLSDQICFLNTKTIRYSDDFWVASDNNYQSRNQYGDHKLIHTIVVQQLFILCLQWFRVNILKNDGLKLLKLML
jgi:hypothetical protein